MTLNLTPVSKPSGGLNLTPVNSMNNSMGSMAFSLNALENIRKGNSQANVEMAKGGGKNAMESLSTVGAQNAGPVGADMMAHAPAFKENIDSFHTAMRATNPEQAYGKASEGLLEAILPTGGGLAKFFAGRKAIKETNVAIDALDTTLKGKKRDLAYQAVGAGNRTATPASLFNTQHVNPDAHTVELATRLKGVLTSKKPLENLTNLGKEMKGTEENIGKMLEGDPSLVYNADKPTLFNKLGQLDSQMPEEFKAIKDSQTMHSAVTNYGKKVLSDAPDTVKGIREARVKFDSQAKTEFPNAYKDGKIDLKTPAGRAIKATRDAFNEHLYSTAPEGSKIKEAILHESDLFRAIEKIAPEASKLEGTNKIRALLEKHPYLATALSAILGTEIANEIKAQL